MFDRVLFPTDGSEAATAALEYVATLARAEDATLHVLNVANTNRYSTVRIQGSILDTLVEDGEQIVDEAVEELPTRELSVVTDVLQGVPDEVVLEYADHHDVDLIVMPTNGRRGLERFLLGSVTERVLRQSEVPVLTLRPGDGTTRAYPPERVLVPTDGSTGADAALDLGIDVVGSHGGGLRVLSVVDTETLGLDVRSEVQIDELEGNADEVVSAAVERAEGAGVEDVSGEVRAGPSVADEILEFVADAEVELVVVGTHGRTGVERHLLGSVAEKLVRRSPVPVVTVRETE
ncbi:MAG: universal stress protein [Haloferacaceae archaeon]